MDPHEMKRPCLSFLIINFTSGFGQETPDSMTHPWVAGGVKNKFKGISLVFFKTQRRSDLFTSLLQDTRMVMLVSSTDFEEF